MGKTRRKASGKDISGQKFGRLTALYPTEKRDAKGFIIWHCKCECGNEADFSYNQLKYSTLRSCGCQKAEHSENLHGYLTHVAGTSIEALQSTRLPCNNTTGVKGVYLIRGRYVAKLIFQGRTYTLGTFERREDAIIARKSAEEAVYARVIAFYKRWKMRAESDPAWAEANPICVNVTQNADKSLTAEITPEWE